MKMIKHDILQKSYFVEYLTKILYITCSEHYMVKKLFFIVFILNSFIFSSISYADCIGTVCEAKVERLYISSGSQILIGTHGDELLLTNCAAVSGVYIKLLDSNPRFDEMYSLLLAAQFKGKEVFIRTVDTAPDPNGNLGSCEVQYVFMES